jgi:hypothetical protein
MASAFPFMVFIIAQIYGSSERAIVFKTMARYFSFNSWIGGMYQCWSAPCFSTIQLFSYYSEKVVYSETGVFS